ncbi:MAG: nucleoside hydrolase, partial [Ignavibacteriales bacterium]|nr:nucleoside hydrolase [Ignavibacteriales bacterium]
MARPILIDTDAGVDDALALILALRSPEARVEAITTVAGNVEVQLCTRNVHRVLEIVEPRRAPRVAQGASHPLQRKLITAPEVHGDDGLGNTLPKLRTTLRVRNLAVQEIISFCTRWQRRGTIISLGPLTNIALALRKNKAALKNAGSIISMGGAFFVPGNTGPVAEFNYFVDPEAVKEVLASGVRLTIVPLN